MRENTISVIIPVYNGEDTIEKCIKSVLKQSKIELVKEIIVVNDGSTDSTQEIVESMIKKNSLIKLVNQQNSGVSKTRNNGIKLALGEWIALLDADDEWFLDKLSKQSEIIDCYNPIMVSCNIRKTVQKIGFFKENKVIKVKPIDMMIRSFPQTSTVLIKKVVFDNLCFNEDQSHTEDINLFTKICSQYDYYHLNEWLVLYGNNKNQFSKHKGLSSDIKAMNNGAKRNLKEFCKLGIINYPLYIVLYVFNEIKYIRRIIKSLTAKSI
ncbi:MAG: glycosyltransferase family 2 protein [Massilimicrobiota sp.]|nr:glycosyltransferase family 2 protein [Massilimicrobiota sp.]